MIWLIFTRLHFGHITWHRLGGICVHFGQQTKHKHDSTQIFRLHRLLLFGTRQLRINFKFEITFSSPWKVFTMCMCLCGLNVQCFVSDQMRVQKVQSLESWNVLCAVAISHVEGNWGPKQWRIRRKNVWFCVRSAHPLMALRGCVSKQQVSRILQPTLYNFTALWTIECVCEFIKKYLLCHFHLTCTKHKPDANSEYRLTIRACGLFIKYNGWYC